MAPKIYHYSRYTGELVGSDDADPSPLEPGKFLIPAHATTTAPPDLAANQAAVFDSAAKTWSTAVDFRGKYFSTVDGSSVSITALGTTLDDVKATATPRPDDTHTWQNGTWAVDATIVAAKAAQVVADKKKAVRQQCAELMGEAHLHSQALMASYVAKELDPWTSSFFEVLGRYQVYLANVPNQPGYPDNVIWPIKPFS